MKQKKRDANEFTPSETQLIKQLREHPEIMLRVQSILEIARNAEGPLKTADEVEELLIQELRRLGNVTLGQWAIQAEERVSTEHKSENPTVRSRKKNADVVVRIWTGGGPRADLVQPHPELPSAFAPAIGSDSTGKVSTTGSGVDGLWLRAGFWPGGPECARALWICDWGQRGAKRHVEPCPPGARKAAGGISATLPCVACSGRALALGLPIGSGMIESGHRHVLQARLKKAGTAWLRDHADQIAHLRVLRANHQWQSLWN